MRWARLAVAVLLAAGSYVAFTAVQVTAAAGGDGAQPVDAIVVLGAAQYDGRPSPALQARLDHAATLYGRDLAETVWVTGGKQPGDRSSEALAASRYLERQGVPSEALQLETHGDSSYESLAAAARYLKRQGHRDVLLVSDPWHSYRIAAIAREVGLRPRVSPTHGAVLSEGSLRRLGRETMAVSLGRLVGYRRLTSINERLGLETATEVAHSRTDDAKAPLLGVARRF